MTVDLFEEVTRRHLAIREISQNAIESSERLDIQLWILVLIVMMGDIILTLFGLRFGLIELNPIVIFGLDTFGYAILAFLKVPALIIGFYGWVTLPPTMRRLNLLGLAIPWAMAVCVNSWLISQQL